MSRSVEQLLRKAKRHAKMGDVQLAEESYKSILATYPQNKRAIEGLKELHGADTKAKNAAHAPTEAQIRELIALYNQRRLEEALIKGEALARKYPNVPFLPNLLGTVNSSLGRCTEAVEHFARALRLRPDYAEAHNNLGNALYSMGRDEDAAKSFVKAVKLRPDYIEAYCNLTLVKKYQNDDPQIRQMTELMEQPGLLDRDRIHLNFALSRVFRHIGDYDKSFHYLVDANRLHDAGQNYDASFPKILATELRSRFSKEVPTLSGDPEVEATGGQVPIFIVGMPRSGTSLVEQILSSHSQVYGAGELTLLGAAIQAIDWRSSELSSDQMRAVRRSYLSALSKIGTRKRYVTDKLPLNFWWIGFIVAAMPEAKIVHMKRDARATCWSNFSHLFTEEGNGFANSLENVAEYYRLYVEMMAFWHEWAPGRIYDLNYETLTEHQEEETRTLLERLGLDWEERCLRFYENDRVVRTASAIQVRKKMYQGSSQEWRRYERQLAPMIELLQAY